jgi:hypothetical protein
LTNEVIGEDIGIKNDVAEIGSSVKERVDPESDPEPGPKRTDLESDPESGLETNPESDPTSDPLGPSPLSIRSNFSQINPKHFFFFLLPLAATFTRRDIRKVHSIS